jgi:hypothetical protein
MIILLAGILRRCFLRTVSETGCRMNTAADFFKMQVA